MADRYEFEATAVGEIPMGRKQDHSARQYSDTMMCTRCGKSWDVNDPSPPECIDEKKQPEGRYSWEKKRSYKPFK